MAKYNFEIELRELGGVNSMICGKTESVILRTETEDREIALGIYSTFSKAIISGSRHLLRKRITLTKDGEEINPDSLYTSKD